MKSFWHDMLEPKKIAHMAREEEYMKNEEFYLTMNDVYGCFYILLVGHGSAGLILLLEMSWHSCLKNTQIMRTLRRKVRKLAYRKRQMKVRRAQVCPETDAEEGTGIEFCY